MESSHVRDGRSTTELYTTKPLYDCRTSCNLRLATDDTSVVAKCIPRGALPPLNPPWLLAYEWNVKLYSLIDARLYECAN